MKTIKSLVRKNILELDPYASAREQFTGVADYYLDANENPYNNGFNRYPDPYQRKLKGIISDRNKLTQEQILLGNGSDELFDIIFRAFCEPGIDNVIVSPPTFGMYQVLADTNNISVKEAPLKADFELDTEKIIDLVDEQTKLVFICSPNNPTGNLMDKSDIITLLENLDCIIVIDEAYLDFSGEDSWTSSLNEYPNLIVCQTFSKAWAHAAIRVGVCFASDEIVSFLDKIRLPYNLNALSQQRAIEVLSEVEAYQVLVNEIIRERNSLIPSLTSLPIVIDVYPSDANFLLVKFTDANRVYDHLIRNGIVIRKLSSLLQKDECMRISIGTPDENKKLISSLRKLM